MVQKVNIFACLVFVILLLFFSPNLLYGDNIVEQKKELGRIQKEIEDSRKNLDSLRENESAILKEISNYEERESMNKTILNRLNRTLSNLRNDIDKSRKYLDSTEQCFSTSQKRYINNLKYYYTGVRGNISNPWAEINKEHDAIRRIIYLKALSAFDKEELTRASNYLIDAGRQYSGLVDEEKSVDNVRRKKQSEYTIITSQKTQKEKDLSKVRREKENEADRLITLSEAARQMEELIVRLERARKARTKGDIDFDFNTGNFVSYRGRLLAPVNGKIISGFGWKTDKITYLKSYSPGIEIKCDRNQSVVAVASGLVVYTGYIRGYSNFLIIEHEDGYYTTYAGLDNLEVVQDQIVDAGEKLGVTPSGIVKFELRKGRDPLDPVEWVKIDSFK
jgi:septal ring factor EnvC (AmiA/AmiB activator)